MTTLQTINASASPEVQMNENAIAVSAAGLFGIKLDTTSGLLLSLYGGILYVDGTATAIADLVGGTRITLTGSQTNYIERTRAGVVSANTTAFTAGRIPLYTVVTSASAITSYTDYRDFTTPLQKARVGVTVTTADVTLSAAQARADEIKATGTLTGNRSIIVPTVAGWWIVDNATSGAFTLTAKTVAGAGIAVPQGYRALVYCDGTDVKEAVTGFAGATSFGGTVTLSGTNANIATGANFISYGGTDAGLSFDASDNATLSAALTVSAGSIINSSTSTAYLDQSKSAATTARWWTGITASDGNWQVYDHTNSAYRLTIAIGTGAVTIPGTLTVSGLAGTGTRAVVVDANGVMSAP